jgi:hypothetical protein
MNVHSLNARQMVRSYGQNRTQFRPRQIEYNHIKIAIFLLEGAKDFEMSAEEIIDIGKGD